MYELKKNGKVVTSKFVGTRPSSYKKNNLPGRGLTKVEKHCYTLFLDIIYQHVREQNCPNTLTLNLLTTTMVAPSSNANKWHMGFNSAFKGLNTSIIQSLLS